MTHALQSYSEGRWQDGTGGQRPPDLLAALAPDGTPGTQGKRSEGER